jgi:hypothetical protein
MKRQFRTLAIGTALATTFLFGGMAKAATAGDQSSVEHNSTRPVDGRADLRDIRIRDSKRQLAHLSKKLKLSSDQKLRVVAILSDRDWQIDLIHESESLPEKSKGTKITNVVVNSNVLVENVLNNNQKQKFEAVLARQNRHKDKNRQA